MNRIFNEKIHVVLTCLLAFCIPCIKVVVAPLIVLLVIIYFLNYNRLMDGLTNLFKNYGFLFMILLYGIHLIGLMNTSNFGFAGEVLETKLSFVILPVIYSCYPEVTKKYWHKYLIFFVFGITIYALFCVFYATYCFLALGHDYFSVYNTYLGVDYFYYINLSRIIHPTYVAMYAVVASWAMYYLYTNKYFKSKVWATFILAFLTVFILLLSSRAGWLGLLFVALYFVYKTIRTKRTWLGVGAIVCLGLLFFVLNMAGTSRFARRIPIGKEVFEAVKNQNAQNEHFVSSNRGAVSRILVWKASLSVFLENFWGVGTGDSKDKLFIEYKKRGMKSELETKLNSHNQFLTNAVANGIPGLILLILVLLYPFFNGLIFDSLWCVFMLVVGFNLLFESMFETQAGVVFFSFFYALFLIVFKRNYSLQA